MAKRLDLTESETDEFCNLVSFSDGRSKIDRRNAEIRAQSATVLGSFTELGQDFFRLIADWYHYAILEMIQLPDFKWDQLTASRRLGISATQAEDAFKRLVKLRLIHLQNGKWVPTHKNLTSSAEVPSRALRKYHRQILEKAMVAISAQSIDERDLSALTVTVNREDVPEFKRKIREFRRSFNTFAELRNRKSKPDHVYCLAIQFFNLMVGEK